MYRWGTLHPQYYELCGARLLAGGMGFVAGIVPRASPVWTEVDRPAAYHHLYVHPLPCSAFLRDESNSKGFG